MQDLIDISLDVIDIFGAAGLRALINKAEVRVGEIEAQVRAKQAKAEEEKAMSEAIISEYDQIALLNIIGSIGGDMDAYDLAMALVRRKVYSVAEMMQLSRVQLRHLLS
ncbi:hypothetical protein D3C76_1546060 [compost metagenome]